MPDRSPARHAGRARHARAKTTPVPRPLASPVVTAARRVGAVRNNARAALHALRRPLAAATSALVAITAALLPLGDRTLSLRPGLTAAALALAISASLGTVLMLLGEFRHRGDARLLGSAAAYLWSIVLLGAVALSFPGVASNDPILPREAAPWLVLGWQVGFSGWLALAWMPWLTGWTAPVPPARRSLTAVSVLTASVLTGLSLIAVVSSLHRSLPAPVGGLRTNGSALVPATVALVAVTAAIVATVRGTARRTGPERWVVAAAVGCWCALVLSVGNPSPSSVGAYAGQLLTLFATTCVLVVWTAHLGRAKVQAEQEADVDPLTGLPTRRGASATLDRILASSRRSGSPLGVLVVDLDDFKQVNERFGYETGDVVLTEVGRLLVEACRTADVVARVGGEEFLVLLPDTNDRGTLIVADKIRRSLSAERIAPLDNPMTISVGATTLQIHDLDTGELIRRSERALSRAKLSGRNRIIMLGGMSDDDILSAL